jgi:hypothetical protein
MQIGRRIVRNRTESYTESDTCKRALKTLLNSYHCHTNQETSSLTLHLSLFHLLPDKQALETRERDEALGFCHERKLDPVDIKNVAAIYIS